MKADRELYSRLEDIHFEYERITSIVSILQQFISEGCVDVTGLPKNVMSYSLYEIEIRLQDITEDLSKIILNGSVLKGGASSMKRLIKETIVLSFPMWFILLMVAYWLKFGYVL